MQASSCKSVLGISRFLHAQAIYKWSACINNVSDCSCTLTLSVLDAYTLGITSQSKQRNDGNEHVLVQVDISTVFFPSFLQHVEPIVAASPFSPMTIV